MAVARIGALVGLDVGTTGARAIAVDLSGNVLHVATEPYPLDTPRPGWTEQDPERWWTASQAALRRVTSELREPVLGLGLTGQMHGSVFLDESNRVIRPALLWNDQRTARQCLRITEKVGAKRLLEITGNAAITGFQAPKILWLRDEEPAAFARVRRVLLPKDFVRLRLTGEYATDASDASGTLLLDLRTRSWSDEVLDRLEIDRDWLPAVHEGPEITGKVLPEVAAAVGLPNRIPVAAGGGDNAAAAVGNGAVEAGIITVSIGTSGVVFAPSESPTIDPKGRVQAFCHAVPGAYHVMGVTLAAGGSFRWWRDANRGALDYDELTALAEEAPPGSEGLVFLPYLSGERTPHLDPQARGAFVGLQLRHSAAHLTRAVMEGVVYSLADCIALVQQLELPITQVRATGGAARSQAWRQLLADVLGLPVHTSQVDEGPAFGAALLAGVACGAFSSVPEASGQVRLAPDANLPSAESTQRYREYRAAYSDLYATLAPAMHRLAELGEQG